MMQPKNKELYYKSGDTLTYSAEYELGGYITSSTTVCQFCLVSPKRLDNINTMTVNTISAYIRTTSGGYINNTSPITQDTSGITFEAKKISSNVFRISIISSSAFTNVSNNTPIGAGLTNINITLS